MKTKAQKGQELTAGKELLSKSEALIFVDVSKVRTGDLGTLRRELKGAGNPFLVIKKRLLGLLLKEKSLPFDAREFKTSVGTVFAGNLESAAASVYKFFKALEKGKKIDAQKILGGLDVKRGDVLDAKRMLAIGALPPREVLLAQLAGMIAAPIRSLLYILKEKASAGGGSASV